jgi:hypothetical protein
MFRKILILFSLLILIFKLIYTFQETFESQKYDALIISPGGGGTTYILEYLYDHTNLRYNDIHDKDRIKHMSFDKENEINNIDCGKIIYIYGDPKLAIDSHYRRNWPKKQLLKLGDPHDMKNRINDKQNFVKQVAEKKYDLYGIEKQFDFFLNSNNLNKKILFIDFYNIKNTKNKIAAFLKIDEKVFDDLHIKERASHYDNNENQKYIEVYEKLYEKMKQYDGYIKEKAFT